MLRAQSSRIQRWRAAAARIPDIEIQINYPHDSFVPPYERPRQRTNAGTYRPRAARYRERRSGSASQSWRQSALSVVKTDEKGCTARRRPQQITRLSFSDVKARHGKSQRNSRSIVKRPVESAYGVDGPGLQVSNHIRPEGASQSRRWTRGN